MSSLMNPRTTTTAGGTAAPARRALFGLLDAAGWGWAFVRAVIWTLVIIFMLGYIPDRAYYLVASSSVELGLDLAPIVNICPAENGGLPCPAPVGALIPWKSGAAASLPGVGVGGTLLQAGSHLYYFGGELKGAVDQFAVTGDAAVAEIGPDGLGAWAPGVALPEARFGAAGAYFAGKAFLVGGTSTTQAATSTVFVATPDATTKRIQSWSAAESLALPAPRTGASIAVVSDGLIVAGGSDEYNTPQATVWKATLQPDGSLGAWKELTMLPSPRVGAAAAIVGDSLYLWGGHDVAGPTAVVLRGEIAVAKSPVSEHGVPAPKPPDNGQGDAPIGSIYRWTATEGSTNLPQAADGAALWSSNGTLYVAGGTIDGVPSHTISWTAPTATNGIGEWLHVDQSDLPEGSERIGAQAAVVGVQALLIGGVDAHGDAATTTLAAGTSPKSPVFRLGLVGLTIPALAIPGEVGQQLGYLSAAGAWTLNFVILLAAAVAYAQRERFAAWLRRLRGRTEPHTS